MKFLFLSILLALTNASTTGESKEKDEESLPNIILIFTDDLGYGDLGCYGSSLNKTPNIDQLAASGVLFTDFYAASGLCTPSRASLLTGSYPIRNNMEQNYRGECVCFPVDEKGLHPDEVTMAELLKQKDYATALIGKWHLGDQPEFLPTRQGFDYFYGLPYSNETPPAYTWRKEIKIYEHPPVPLLKNEEVIEAPVKQENLTQRYTQEALKFIKDNKAQPFFLYFAHTMPYGPLYAGEKFAGKSENGTLGDVVEEIDGSVGEIMNLLEELKLKENTLVIFTSDNGAPKKPAERSNPPLSGYKGTIAEGGMRVPMIMNFPEKSPSPYAYFAYYQMDQLQAIRAGKWKLYLELGQKKNMWGSYTGPAKLKLYDLSAC